MDDKARTDRFLDALDPAIRHAPGDGAGARDSRPADWPEAIEHRPFSFDGPVDAQLLDDRHIATYLASLGAAGAATARGIPRVCDLDDAWTASRLPLVLSEYLAYKAALAYRDPADVLADLTGTSNVTGAPYNDGIEAAAFFDSAARWARLSDAADGVAGAHDSHSRPFTRIAPLRYADTQAIAFARQRTGYIILRGTDTWTDVVTDLHDQPTDRAYPRLSDLEQMLAGAPRPARHTGFAIAWGAIAPDVEAWVRNGLRDGVIDRIVLSGHSLGGALAILAAYHFAEARICPVHAVITFGAPKLAAPEFRRAYENPALGLAERTLRLEAADDLVTILDRRWDGYEHVGHAWRLTRRPLRPWWQMVLWAPLIAPELAASRRITENARKRQREPASPSPPRGRNAPARLPARSWRQTVGAIAARLAWFATRRLARAYAAHSIENRYALYLSTLSYRKIRAAHIARARLRLLSRRSYENERILMETAFRIAGSDLERHLAVMRGAHPKTFRRLKRRPVRVTTPAELARIEKRFRHYIA